MHGMSLTGYERWQKRWNSSKNGEGYSDPTASEAIHNVTQEKPEDLEYIHFKKLLDTIFNICDLAGFHVEGRIVLKNKKTGRIWR